MGAMDRDRHVEERGVSWPVLALLAVLTVAAIVVSFDLY